MDTFPPIPAATVRLHGGPDAGGVARFDFSTNANACGPAPAALAAVRAADPAHYPDPRYTRLVDGLAARHGIAPTRIVPAASASEAIFRLTAWVVRGCGGAAPHVWMPRYAYGDYAAAARAWRLPVAHDVAALAHAALAWLCDPASPVGADAPERAAWSAAPGVRVLDCAYAPLRLAGGDAWRDTLAEDVWQLWTPNKALGLTGVRGAYLIAPRGGGEAAAAELAELAPSWPIGAHGVALLAAWCEADVERWLAESRATLATWKAGQLAACSGLGWMVQASVANFHVARPAWPNGRPLAPGEIASALAALRRRGVQLRDAASLGLPGWVRMAVLPPQAVQALRTAWAEVCGEPAARGAAPATAHHARETEAMLRP